jgi:hypothetical protein
MTSSHNYASANKNYFNDPALTYDDHPKIIELAKRSVLKLQRVIYDVLNASVLRSAQAIRKHYPFDEDSTLVMDFACGSG